MKAVIVGGIAGGASYARAYYSTRILLQSGFKARNISGGMLSRAMLAANLGGEHAPNQRES